MVSKRGMLAIVAVVVVAIIGYVIFGMAGGKQQQAGSKGVQVKVMSPLRQDTPLTLEYAGSVKGKEEVKVQARVSGTIVAKYIKGGQQVTAGQALYKIDDRQ